MKTIPESEYNNLAKKVCNIIPKLLDDGKFHNQGTIEQRKTAYIMNSNPLPEFINKLCNKDSNLYIEYGELYNGYVAFLKKNKMRKVTHKEFKSSLEDEGLYVEKTSKKITEHEYKNTRWVEGIHLWDNWDIMLQNLFESLHERDEMKVESQNPKSPTTTIPKEDIIRHLTQIEAKNGYFEWEHEKFAQEIKVLALKGEVYEYERGKGKVLR